MNKKNKIILIVTIISILLVFGGITYAYFTANINNAEDSSTVTITGGKLAITYDNLSNVIKIENIYPRPAAWVEKNFTVTGTNTTDLKMNYKLGLEVMTSNFSADKLSATLSNTNTAAEKAELDGTPVADTTKGVPASGTIWFGNGDFNTTDPTEIHKYTLSIYYLDDNTNQNNNQQKSFSGKVVIVEAGTGDLPILLNDAVKTNSLNANNPTLTTPGVDVATSDEGLRTTIDDYGTSYYYRGAVENNYIVFADMCWRIVRVDGAGNTKLVLYNYNPNNAENPCSTSEDGTSNAFARYDSTTNGQAGKSLFNSPADKNAYVGYTYGTPGSSTYDAEHTKATPTVSKILTNLKTWYDAKFSVAQKAQLADVIWCNDKSLNTDTGFKPDRSYTNLGYDTNKTYYGAVTRLIADKATSWTKATTSKVTLVCPDAGSDGKLSKYTASDTNNGNGYLTINGNEYKIGLLTADEIAFAGAVYNSTNNAYYLNKNASSYLWWSLSPSNFFSTNTARVWEVSTDGALLHSGQVNAFVHVRPSVSLVSTTTITGGTGTQASPFVVQ